METYIQEENVFKYLTWVCHTLCGLCISMLVGDNYLFNEYNSSIIHRSCTKFPKLILVDLSVTIAFKNVYLTMHTLVIIVGLGINIAIFFKQRQLESQQSVAEFSVSYNTSDVKIIRKSNQPSNCSLWRFRRNVISPLGSFSSFLVSVVYSLPVYYIILSITPSGPSVLGELYLSSIHCVYFFWLNIVETICSPTLRSSIINVLPWSRNEYNVVIV